jgi:hypothetical protein
MKNILILLLVVIALFEGAYIIKVRNSRAMLAAEVAKANAAKPTGSPSPRPPMFLKKGDKLHDAAVSKFAYLVFPGEVSADAKKALIGYGITSKKQGDGSMLVTFTPKDSDDQMMEYVVKDGQSLYFVEQNPGDDDEKGDKDLNYRDDYGIIVDANDIVQ